MKQDKKVLQNAKNFKQDKVFATNVSFQQKSTFAFRRIKQAGNLPSFFSFFFQTLDKHRANMYNIVLIFLACG